MKEEADLVRRIYREYLSGYSPGMIARHLNNESIPTPSGSGEWYQSTVISILQNEKYCSDFLMQKYYVIDDILASYDAEHTSASHTSADASSVDESDADDPACRDYEDFFRRTRYRPEPGLIGRDGKIKYFSDNMVIRFLEKAVVTDEGYEVHFKAKVVITVPA